MHTRCHSYYYKSIVCDRHVHHSFLSAGRDCVQCQFNLSHLSEIPSCCFAQSCLQLKQIVQFRNAYSELSDPERFCCTVSACRMFARWPLHACIVHMKTVWYCIIRDSWWLQFVILIVVQHLFLFAVEPCFSKQGAKGYSTSLLLSVQLFCATSIWLCKHPTMAVNTQILSDLFKKLYCAMCFSRLWLHVSGVCLKLHWSVWLVFFFAAEDLSFLF